MSIFVRSAASLGPFAQRPTRPAVCSLQSKFPASTHFANGAADDGGGWVEVGRRTAPAAPGSDFSAGSHTPSFSLGSLPRSAVPPPDPAGPVLSNAATQELTRSAPRLIWRTRPVLCFMLVAPRSMLAPAVLPRHSACHSTCGMCSAARVLHGNMRVIFPSDHFSLQARER